MPSLNQLSVGYGTLITLPSVTKLGLRQGISTISSLTGPYRPVQWTALPHQPELLALVRPVVVAEKPIVGEDEKVTVVKEYYFFDAFIREDHRSSVRKTEHPIQDGVAITDHAYRLPRELVVEILMSDVMDAVIPNTFVAQNTFASQPISVYGYRSKSVSAFEALLNIQEARLPVSITTRLHKYENMVIEDIRASDDFTTMNGLRCMVVFSELIVGNVVEFKKSRVPHKNEETPKADVQAKPEANQSSVLNDIQNHWSGD